MSKFPTYVHLVMVMIGVGLYLVGDYLWAGRIMAVYMWLSLATIAAIFAVLLATLTMAQKVAPDKVEAILKDGETKSRATTYDAGWTLHNGASVAAIFVLINTGWVVTAGVAATVALVAILVPLVGKKPVASE
jgi:hypothetical protein